MKRTVDLTLSTTIVIEVKDDANKSDADIAVMAENMAMAHIDVINWDISTIVLGDC